jgi:hypothetical protein
MNNAGDRTHKARAIDPAKFRNLATGVGQCADESEATGARRAQRAADCAPALQRAVIDPSYPTPGQQSADWTPAPSQEIATPVVILPRKGRG